MSEPLGNYQYEILRDEDDANPVRFGLGLPIDVPEDGFKPGGSTMRTDDQLLDGRDGVAFGADLETPGSWTFDTFTGPQCYDARTAKQAWRELIAVWPAKTTVRKTGGLQMLRYSIDGEVRRVYGRPRKREPNPNNDLLSGKMLGSIQFDLVDARSFSDDEHSVSLNSIPVATTGRKFPAKFPWRAAGAAEATSTVAAVTGFVEAPVRIQVEGPQTGFATGLSIRCALWEVKIRRLEAGEVVIVDSRPWVAAAVRPDGSGYPQALAAPTQVAGLELTPGSHQFFMSGVDPTGTAKATVFWRDAEASF